MNLTKAWLFALAGVTAAGIITWACLAVARVMEDVRAIDNFKGMHLDE